MKRKRTPESQMHRDLSVKFLDDLQSLIIRSLSIMSTAIDMADASDIILSSLSACGAVIERDTNCRHGLFVEMAEWATTEMYAKKGRE